MWGKLPWRQRVHSDSTQKQLLYLQNLCDFHRWVAGKAAEAFQQFIPDKDTGCTHSSMQRCLSSELHNTRLEGKRSPEIRIPHIWRTIPWNNAKSCASLSLSMVHQHSKLHHEKSLVLISRAELMILNSHPKSELAVRTKPPTLLIQSRQTHRGKYPFPLPSPVLQGKH